MKRGWITWDKAVIPPAAFEARLGAACAHLAAHDLAALVVYSDVWKSNQGRYFSNFMPYWNRALIVIPRDGAPVLLVRVVATRLSLDQIGHDLRRDQAEPQSRTATARDVRRKRMEADWRS